MPRGTSPKVGAEQRLRTATVNARRFLDSPIRPEPRGTTETRANKHIRKVSTARRAMSNEVGRVASARTRSLSPTRDNRKRVFRDGNPSKAHPFVSGAGRVVGDRRRAASKNVEDRRGARSVSSAPGRSTRRPVTRPRKRP